MNKQVTSNENRVTSNKFYSRYPLLITLFLVLSFVFCHSAFAFPTWLEAWNNASYYQTNYERTGFSAMLARYQGKIGSNVSLLEPYFSWDGVTSQDTRHWNNQLICGAGIRAYAFRGFPFPAVLGFLRETKIFAELQQVNYFKDQTTASANKTNNLRAGLDLWYEWNQSDIVWNKGFNPYFPWAELWSGLYYNSTNFSTTDFNNSIFYFQPKIGFYLASSIKPYVRLDLATSGDSSYWLNTAALGGGIRFEPFREKAPEEWYGALINKFKMFVEFVNLSYLKSQNPSPATTDVRFGIDFAYGATGR